MVVGVVVAIVSTGVVGIVVLADFERVLIVEIDEGACGTCTRSTLKIVVRTYRL